MNDTILDIIRKRVEHLKEIENKLITKELDEALDENLYIRTLEKHILLLEIIDEYNVGAVNEEKEMIDIDEIIKSLDEEDNDNPTTEVDE